MQLKFQPSEELKSAKALIPTFILFQAVGGYTPISKYESLSAFSLKAEAILDIDFFNIMENNHTLFISDFIAVTSFVVSVSKPAFPPSISPVILPTLLLICGETARAGSDIPPPRVVGMGQSFPPK